MSYTYDRRASKDTANLMKEVVSLAEEAARVERDLESKIREIAALEKTGKLPPSESGVWLSRVIEDQLFRLNKGHFNDALEAAHRLLRSGWLSNVP